MARTTKQLSGGGKDKFLRAIVESDAEISEAAARRVVEALISSVTEIRVRREVWEDVSKAQPDEPKRKPGERPVGSGAAATPAAKPTVPDAAAVPVFDPYSFSAVAVLSKKGRDALVAALETISAAEQLHKLAVAQHLAVDPNIASVADIRAAIIEGAERRIAERRAAAS